MVDDADVPPVLFPTFNAPLFSIDVVVPTYAVPFLDIRKSVEVEFAVELDIKNAFASVSPLLREIANFAHGVDVLIPMLPFAEGVDETGAPFDP